MEDNIFGKGNVGPKKECPLVEADSTNPFSDVYIEEDEVNKGLKA